MILWRLCQLELTSLLVLTVTTLEKFSSLSNLNIKFLNLTDATVTNEVIVPVSNENIIELKVQSRNKGSQVMISLRPADPMTVLFEKYAEATSTSLNKMTFKFDGEIIEEDDTPTSLDLEGGECIDVHIKSDWTINLLIVKIRMH